MTYRARCQGRRNRRPTVLAKRTAREDRLTLRHCVLGPIPGSPIARHWDLQMRRELLGWREAAVVFMYGDTTAYRARTERAKRELEALLP